MNKYQNIFNCIEGQSIIVTTLNGKIDYINPGAKILFGYENELKGKTLNILYPKENIDKESLHLDQSDSLQWQGLNKSGKRLTLEVKNTSLCDNGKVIGYVNFAKEMCN